MVVLSGRAGDEGKERKSRLRMRMRRRKRVEWGGVSRTPGGPSEVAVGRGDGWRGRVKRQSERRAASCGSSGSSGPRAGEREGGEENKPKKALN